VCRMIAAVGRFDPAAVRRALVTMAANENPAHDHEHRSEGASFRHTDGWGMAWAQDGQLRTIRRTISVLLDDWVERVDPLQTELLLLHARKATQPRSIATANTHPFPAALLGRDWAFCHNGAIAQGDLYRLLPAPGMARAGGTDSDRLFHHFLAELAMRTTEAAQTEAPAGSPSYDEHSPFEAALAATIAVPQDFTSLHCLAASTDRVLAAACRHPVKSQPAYHALWLGEGPGVRVVSSEPVDGLGCAWKRLPEPGVVTLHVVSKEGGPS
jgi:predicted glutamine amidotransferase